MLNVSANVIGITLTSRVILMLNNISANQTWLLLTFFFSVLLIFKKSTTVLANYVIKSDSGETSELFNPQTF